MKLPQSHNADEAEAIKVLSKRGYKHTTTSSIGKVFERVTRDGFLDKMCVTSHGVVLRYKTEKANSHELQSLNRIRTKYEDINFANL